MADPEAMAEAWWRRQEPRPVDPLSQSVTAVRAVLEAGHGAAAVERVLASLEPPLTARRLEYALIGRAHRRIDDGHTDHWATPGATF